MINFYQYGMVSGSPEVTKQYQNTIANGGILSLNERTVEKLPLI